MLGGGKDERARREKDVAEFASSITYSKRYTDDTHEYR